MISHGCHNIPQCPHRAGIPHLHNYLFPLQTASPFVLSDQGPESFLLGFIEDYQPAGARAIGGGATI